MTTRILLAAGILAGLAACFVTADDADLSDSEYAGARRTTRAATDAIERALTTSIAWKFTDNPLSEALDYLEDELHISIWVDEHALSDEGINTDQQITLVMRSAPLQTGLRLILDPLDLTYFVEDGVLKVTTKQKASELMTTSVYPVPELLGIRQDGSDDYFTLMTAIEEATSGKWEPRDGEGGSLRPVPIVQSLVIRQTWKVHREIAGILAALRRAKGLPNIAAISAEPALIEKSPFQPFPESQTTARSRAARTTRSWQQPRVYSAE